MRLHDAGMGLDVSLMHRLGGESIFDDEVGIAEARFDIALGPSQIDEDVARCFYFVQQAAVRLHVGMQQGRARLDGFEGIEQRFQLFVLNLDQFRRGLGDLLALRRDHRDFLADEANDLVGKHRHVVDFSADELAFDIGTGHHGMNTRQGERFAGIDFLDSSVSESDCAALWPRACWEVPRRSHRSPRPRLSPGLRIWWSACR